jgi:Protein of unknown function, DUF547
VRTRLGAGLGLAGALLLVVGCAADVPTPRAVSPAAGNPEAAWAEVLSRFVDEQGRIDFAGISREPAALETYVAWLARAPEPADRDAKLAFLINAYNALAMYNAVRSGIPRELDSIKLRFFYRDRFELAGRRISLYALENQVIRPLGDPRVHFALNCMAVSCPRLPKEQFRAETLDADLERLAREFFADPRNASVDATARKVRFSEILKFYTEDFLKAAPSLIAYANRHRAEQIPAEFETDFIPYDWTLNKQ